MRPTVLQRLKSLYDVDPEMPVGEKKIRAVLKLNKKQLPLLKKLLKRMQKGYKPLLAWRGVGAFYYIKPDKKTIRYEIKRTKQKINTLKRMLDGKKKQA